MNDQIVFHNHPKEKYFGLNFNAIWFVSFLDKYEIIKKSLLTQKLIRHRNFALIIYISHFILCIIRIGLFSVRIYLIAIIVNIILLFISIGGIYGCLTLKSCCIIGYTGATMIVYILFFLMMVISFRDETEDSKREILVFCIPLYFEIIIILAIIYFTNIVDLFERTYKEKKMKIDLIQIPDNRAAIKVNENNEEFVIHIEKKENVFDEKNYEIIIKDKNKIIDENFCCVCFMIQPNSVFCPCGHVSACFECGKTVKNKEGKCPICRKVINDVVKIYKT